jgi:hypothetical protein
LLDRCKVSSLDHQGISEQRGGGGTGILTGYLNFFLSTEFRVSAQNPGKVSGPPTRVARGYIFKPKIPI